MRPTPRYEPERERQASVAAATSSAPEANGPPSVISSR